MTLIVSALCRESFVLQVADRRVTTQDGRTFDNYANKNIIYWAEDAIVCIGYTGPAFIERLSTDTWIAWKLCGKELSKNLRGVLLTQPPRPQLHIWQAMKALESELKLSEIATLSLDFELVVAGWKWRTVRRITKRTKMPIPFAWSIRKPRGREIEMKRLDRDWTKGGRFIVLPDGNMSNEISQKMVDRIRDLSFDTEIPAEQSTRFYENAIVDAIRAVSAKNPYVGPDCMSILIAPPHLRPFVRVTSFSQKTDFAQELGVNAPPQYRAAFTPWIIGPSSVMAPQIIYGLPWCTMLGPFEIRLGGFADADRGAGMAGMQGQPRRPRPL